jgi:hypothetical protein
MGTAQRPSFAAFFQIGPSVLMSPGLSYFASIGPPIVFRTFFLRDGFDQMVCSDARRGIAPHETISAPTLAFFVNLCCVF